MGRLVPPPTLPQGPATAGQTPALLNFGSFSYRDGKSGLCSGPRNRSDLGLVVLVLRIFLRGFQ